MKDLSSGYLNLIKTKEHNHKQTLGSQEDETHKINPMIQSRQVRRQRKKRFLN